MDPSVTRPVDDDLDAAGDGGRAGELLPSPSEPPGGGHARRAFGLVLLVGGGIAAAVLLWMLRDGRDVVEWLIPAGFVLAIGFLLRARHGHGGRQLIEWLILIGSALAIALLIKTFLFQAFYIPSESMVPTLQKDDRVLVNKLSYRLHDVHRGDIVVFESPPETQDEIKDLVKRVVGLPGEHVEVKDGHVFVDGDQLEENYLPIGTVSVATNGTSAWDVPSNAVFVMGDNRTSSNDSRAFGPIPEDDIVGRVFVRIWPLSRIGFM